MESLNSHYGFDAAFVDKPPELYQCTVCGLVLRDPVMILKCGHRYCRPCFERLNNYSKQVGTELLCPVDRDLIDLSKVCDDHGLRRAVSKLVVKCREWERGCAWQGELSELEHHESSCEYKPCPNVTSSSEELKGQSVTVKMLLERLDTFEHKFKEKEKEVAYLNHRVEGLEEKCNLKFKEVDLLKQSNEKYEKKLKTLENELVLVKSNAKGTQLQKEDAGNERGKATVAPKEIIISLLKGNPQAVKVMRDHHVHFTCGNSWCTVVAFNGAVRCLPYAPYEKGFFEVTIGGGTGDCWIGWASEEFFTSAENVVGNCPRSYGFNVKCCQKLHNKQKGNWGVKMAANRVLGVAIDTERKEILYGADGHWNAPLGVAFRNIYYPSYKSLFPVISGGGDLTLLVNFGQVEFKYGPPHPSFKNLITMGIKK